MSVNYDSLGFLSSGDAGSYSCKMLRKEMISIILHDINIYFPGKRALKTDSLIEERRCGQLAPRQSTRGSIIAPPAEFKTCTEQNSPEISGGQNIFRKTESSRGQSATVAECG